MEGYWYVSTWFISIVSFVIAILVSVIVWRDHCTNVHLAKLQLDLDTLSNERDQLAREVSDFNEVRSNDMQAATIREGELRSQLDRAERIIVVNYSPNLLLYVRTGKESQLNEHARKLAGLPAVAPQ